MSKNVLLGVAVAAVLAVFSPPVRAHGGEDHGAAVASPVATTSRPSFAAEGAAFQVALVAVGDGTTLVYLAHGDSNAPVVGATIEAEAGTWQGRAQAQGADGIYVLPWAPGVDPVDVSLIITAHALDDLLLVQGFHVVPPAMAPAAPLIAHWTHWAGGAGIGVGVALVLGLARRRRKAVVTSVALALVLASGHARAHGGEDHGAAAAASVAPPPGAVLVMSKATQFLLGIRTQRVDSQEAADTQRVVGRVIPDPAGFARVQPSQPARVLASTDIPLPVAGQVVKRGQVLAMLEPTLSALEKGDRRAALARIDSDLAVQEREVPRMIALQSAIPFRTLETARIRLEQLRREREQIAGTVLGRELLVAPLDGVVADVHLVPGEVVTADRALVEIIDPTRLRIEAIIHDPAMAARLSGATASTKLVPDQIFPLKPLGVSPRIDPVDMGVHAVFAVDSAQAALLRVGLPVDVFLATGATRLRIAVPRDAIAESGGRQVVFVRMAPEAFEARPIRIHKLVGPLAEIEGVSMGERIVTQGIEQMKAAR